jgi:hypothetical protein
MRSHRPAPSGAVSLALAALLTLGAARPAAGQSIPSPEEYFGHAMGADRQLVRWDRLVEYYQMLGEASDRIVVQEVGPTTLGNPFLVLWISSPENLANLDEIQRMNHVLSDPRGHDEQVIEAAVRDGKVVFLQAYGLHSTEVAASQTAAEVAWLFATRTDEEMTQILDETVSIIVPGMNPDGTNIVTDWYDQWVGTEYEGSGPPELYHHYVGHDNNRDAFMQNTVESQYVAELLFRAWTPQAFIDHHQMGAYTARIYLPPYAEPIRPGGDPLVWREMAWYGAQMAYKMDEHDLPGAIGAAIYSGWGHFGFHWITPFHNIAGMLTESASARLATPLYVHPDQLEGSRQLPEYEEQTTFPSPWQGGWWRVRDIVERQVVATFSPLELAAKNRQTVLRNAYNKATRQTQRGAEGDVKAFVISVDQHDPLTMQKMVNKLLLQGITVERATRDFVHEGRAYGSGSYVVSMAQPKRGVIRWLLGQTYYPDNSYTRDRQGDPIRPYDMSTDNLAEFMGVRVDPVASPITASLTRVTGMIDPSGTVTAGASGYVLDGRLNDSFEAVNLLFAAGVSVRRAWRDGSGVRQGDFVVAADADPAVVRRIAEETGVDFAPLGADASASTFALTRQRVGMYQRYHGGNMDEGWTRWLLEDFSFEYASIMDAEILRGALHERWDVIVLPADSRQMMVDGPNDVSSTPPPYRSGFGDEGVAALREFVENGGTLVTFAQAGDLPLADFDLPVENAVEGVWGNDFWSPGSTLHMRVDTTDPFAWGMPRDALATYLAGGQVYETVAGARSADVRRLATYPERDILRSGWLLGEEAIANRAAVVAVDRGEGTVLMLGFRAQHRAQTHGTFKLFFNALMQRPRPTSGVAAGGGGPA